MPRFEPAISPYPASVPDPMAASIWSCKETTSLSCSEPSSLQVRPPSALAQVTQTEALVPVWLAKP